MIVKAPTLQRAAPCPSPVAFLPVHPSLASRLQDCGGAGRRHKKGAGEVYLDWAALGWPLRFLKAYLRRDRHFGLSFSREEATPAVLSVRVKTPLWLVLGYF